MIEGANLEGQAFEDVNSLLQKCSPLYREAFGDNLMGRLLQLQGERRSRFSSSDDEGEG